MKITINPFDSKSIENAIKYVRRYNVNDKINIILKELTERGFNIAKVKFSNAEYDGTNDVQVYIEQSGDKFRLVARGESVAFIEFGTGIKYNPQGNASYYGERPTGIVGIGEYGKKKGSTGHRWYYDHGKFSYGNKPAMAMYGATQEMLLEVMQIARRVFND